MNYGEFEKPALNGRNLAYFAPILQAGGAEGAGIEPGLAERMQKSLTQKPRSWDASSAKEEDKSASEPSNKTDKKPHRKAFAP